MMRKAMKGKVVMGKSAKGEGSKPGGRTALYGGYDREGLEREYSGSAREPHLEAPKAAREARIASENARVLAEEPRLLDLVYGPHPRQRIDWYPTADPFAPVFVFFHGGYWKSRSKAMFAWLAPGFTHAGINFAAVGYPLAPEARLQAIVESCRRALHWILSYPSGLRFDPTRLHVGGHSAGGHLAAMMQATDWRRYGLPAEAIRSATCISGLYDLVPLTLVRQHRDLAIDREEARLCSPLVLNPPAKATLIATVGGKEGDEFQRNTRALAEAWGARGHRVITPRAEGLYHFNILDDLATPRRPLHRAVMTVLKNA